MYAAAPGLPQVPLLPSYVVSCGLGHHWYMTKSNHKLLGIRYFDFYAYLHYVVQPHSSLLNHVQIIAAELTNRQECLDFHLLNVTYRDTLFNHFLSFCL